MTTADVLALWALIVSGGALIVSLFALGVAILDWQQITREEPWKITKLDAEHWLLERVHRRRVFITSAFAFHHSTVEFVNDAAFPAAAFRRGTTAVLHMAANGRGRTLTIISRKARRGENNNTYYEHAGTLVARKGEREFRTALY